MSQHAEGWLTRMAVAQLHRAAQRRAETDPEWSAAIVAELPSVPAGSSRFAWALGGLWFLIVHRPALLHRSGTRLSRLFALGGVAWTAMWITVFVSSIVDDAPDIPIGHGTWLVAAHAAVLALFVLALWRPILATMFALPAVAWLTAVVNSPVDINGNRLESSVELVITLALFTLPLALFFGAIAVTAASQPSEVAERAPQRR